MNIAFDAAAIFGPMSKNRGIGNYAVDQFKTMIQRDTENRYFLLNFFEDVNMDNWLPESENFSSHYFYCGKDNFLLSNPEYQEVIGDIIKKFNREYSIDIFYITSPFESRNVKYKKEWFGNVNVVATVYDIIPYVFKDRYIADSDTYEWYMSCIEMLKWIDKLYVISNSVKDDMIKYLEFDPNQIDVIYGAVSEMYKEIEISEGQVNSLFSKFGIENDYIMCTGGDDDRKNIGSLILAYSKMPAELIEKYQLVVVCKLSAEAVDKYIKIINENGIAGRVILTNFVSSSELIQLYNKAYLMAFPSQYEGFGLPIVEAWACGTPVLTSDNSSLGEIAAESAILVNPFEVQSITEGLVYALKRADLDEFIEKGRKRLEKFRWNVVADATIELLNQLVEKKVSNDTKQKAREKIAFFTPLPPLQSGISDYSVDIIGELSQYFDIDVYIDNGYKANCELADNVNIYNHKKFKKKEAGYFDIVYQMGNSEYHEYMMPYIKANKGTVVLHDYNLHSLLQYLTLYKQSNNMKQYEKYLLEDFDIETVEEYLKNLQNRTTDIEISGMELNGCVSNYANKIIVHSDEAREKLLTRNIGRNVRCIRHYAKIESLVDKSTLKTKNNFLEDEIVIASFGHIHETKRAIPILKAFAMLCKKYNNLRYNFVGKLDKGIKNNFEDIVQQHNLGELVTVTGYTELEQFEEFIDFTDICVNLRHPYNGETSGSLMRELAKGKCVLINNLGSFSEIPDEGCVKIPPVSEMQEHEEVQAIYDALEALVEDRARIDEIGMKAREYAIKNLALDKIGIHYKNFICNQEKSAITEKIMKDIIGYELIDKSYNSEEVKQLATTLGYSKSYMH
ncbi:glycosyltransferase [Anaerobium acetethylicum]|uniref:Glycosyltransferase involved in cell wall bisynthesis n=1 Tax=Anaerobium acetethylicum TaxID=1619234 RepID=A0A1D3TQE1_9FIRM|nr:glycosyltransferase [Anaerobium acetethylicum]SCP95750.1 Glycosyltransferase involved in cell wall bisynthesis [Anaerobium acetethylicum]